MTALHGWLTYLLLAGSGLGALWQLYRWLRGASFEAPDARLSTIFVAGMYLQFILGILLFVLWPRNLTAPLHPLVGVGALLLAHWGHGRSEIPATRRHAQRALTYLGAGALLYVILRMI